MNFMKNIFLLTLLAFFCIGNAKTDSLRNQIQSYLKPYKATVGNKVLITLRMEIL